MPNFLTVDPTIDIMTVVAVIAAIWAYVRYVQMVNRWSKRRLALIHLGHGLNLIGYEHQFFRNRQIRTITRSAYAEFIRRHGIT